MHAVELTTIERHSRVLNHAALGASRGYHVVHFHDDGEIAAHNEIHRALCPHAPLIICLRAVSLYPALAFLNDCFSFSFNHLPCRPSFAAGTSAAS